MKVKKRATTRSTQLQKKRETAKLWFYTLMYSGSRYAESAAHYKQAGHTYVEIMDHFAGMGYK